MKKSRENPHKGQLFPVRFVLLRAVSTADISLKTCTRLAPDFPVFKVTFGLQVTLFLCLASSYSLWRKLDFFPLLSLICPPSLTLLSSYRSSLYLCLSLQCPILLIDTPLFLKATKLSTSFPLSVTGLLTSFPLLPGFSASVTLVSSFGCPTATNPFSFSHPPSHSWTPPLVPT